MQRGDVIIILSFSFVVFCLLFLFACVVLPHYVVNKDEYIGLKSAPLRVLSRQTGHAGFVAFVYGLFKYGSNTLHGAGQLAGLYSTA